MCDVLLPLGVNPTAVKYIYISYHATGEVWMKLYRNQRNHVRTATFLGHLSAEREKGVTFLHDSGLLRRETMSHKYPKREAIQK
jgi:hypothetical protein